MGAPKEPKGPKTATAGGKPRSEPRSQKKEPRSTTKKAK